LKRYGHTLMELMVVIIVISILASTGVVKYFKTVERSKSSEAYVFFDMMRKNYLRARDIDQDPRVLGNLWNPDIAAATNPDWEYMGMDNPNADTRANFIYDIWTPGFSAYGITAVHYTIICFRRKGQPPYPAYTGQHYTNKYIFMDLDTGDIGHSTEY